MRQDMYKVIVERPRRAGVRDEIPEPCDLDDSPRQEGLRRRHRHRKYLNENLRPLERYLAAQVNRPWDKVYSEICAGIDRRNTVQQHVFEHLKDFVAVRTRQVDGELYYDDRWGRPRPIAENWGPKFYVDPHTKLLRMNKARIVARRKWLQDHRDKLRQAGKGLREDRRIVDATTQLHRIEGVWYRIEIAAVPAIGQSAGNAVDALRRLPVDQCPAWKDSGRIRSNHGLFGRADVYACGKKQASAAELRKHGLFNDDACQDVE